MIKPISFPCASLVPIVDMPLLSDERWQELAGQQQTEQLHDTPTSTTISIASLARDWRCSHIESAAAIEFDCETLIDTCQFIAEAVTFERIYRSMADEFYRYLKNDYYRGTPSAADDDFLRDLAREMAHEDAWDCVYEYGITDDYATIDENEKAAVIFDSDV